MVPFVGPTSISPAPLLVQPVKNEPDHFWQAEFAQSGPISGQVNFVETMETEYRNRNTESTAKLQRSCACLVSFNDKL